MGLIDDFRRAITGSPGRVLLMQMENKIRLLGCANGEVLANSIMKFIELREISVAKLANMTSQGRIKMGIKLQRMGNGKFDFDIAEGFAFWATGAWIESQERPGHEAREVFNTLNSLALRAEEQFLIRPNNNANTSNTNYSEAERVKHIASRPSRPEVKILHTTQKLRENPQDAVLDESRVNEKKKRREQKKAEVRELRLEQYKNPENNVQTIICPECGSQKVAKNFEGHSPTYCFSCKKILSS